MKSNSIIVGRVNNHAMARSDMFNSFVLIVFSIASFVVHGYLQRPSCHNRNFSGSGFQPRHLISRLKTAPTSLVLALSVYPDCSILARK